MGAFCGWVLESVGKWSRRSPGRAERVVDRTGSEVRLSNNQAEYEALIAGMLLAKEMGARSLLAKSDSQLVTG